MRRSFMDSGSSARGCSSRLAVDRYGRRRSVLHLDSRRSTAPSRSAAEHRGPGRGVRPRGRLGVRQLARESGRSLVRGVRRLGTGLLLCSRRRGRVRGGAIKDCSSEGVSRVERVAWKLSACRSYAGSADGHGFYGFGARLRCHARQCNDADPCRDSCWADRLGRAGGSTRAAAVSRDSLAGPGCLGLCRSSIRRGAGQPMSERVGTMGRWSAARKAPRHGGGKSVNWRRDLRSRGPSTGPDGGIHVADGRLSLSAAVPPPGLGSWSAGAASRSSVPGKSSMQGSRDSTLRRPVVHAGFPAGSSSGGGHRLGVRRRPQQQRRSSAWRRSPQPTQ